MFLINNGVVFQRRKNDQHCLPIKHYSQESDGASIEELKLQKTVGGGMRLVITGFHLHDTAHFVWLLHLLSTFVLLVISLVIMKCYCV